MTTAHLYLTGVCNIYSYLPGCKISSCTLLLALLPSALISALGVCDSCPKLESLFVPHLPVTIVSDGYCLWCSGFDRSPEIQLLALLVYINFRKLNLSTFLL